MQVILELRSGDSAKQQMQLLPGQICQVGKVESADFNLAADPYLSGLHFGLSHDNQACYLRDLDSRTGTFLNGIRISEAVISDGDHILAGQSEFVVRIEFDQPAVITRSMMNAMNLPSSNLVVFLRGQTEPLFALFDAARDSRVLEVLNSSDAEWQSLYAGVRGLELAPFGPFLVALPFTSPLLETLVREGWDRSWGVYLTSRKSFSEIHKHFRRFLMVELEDGQEAYFRFYDPRVMRTFLPTCTAEESKDFFGPVSSYLVEAEQPGLLLKFARGADGVRCQEISVGVGEAV